MLLIVNCQNGFVERCNSAFLRNIVDSVELLPPVRLLAWQSPPAAAYHRKGEKSGKIEYDSAIYPELNKHNFPTYWLKDPHELPKEIIPEIKKDSEVFIIGGNTDGWLVKLALCVWSLRIKPKFIADAWFSVGPVGCHGDATNELTRQFGAAAFNTWAGIRDPILKKRAEMAAAAAGQKSPEPPIV